MSASAGDSGHPRAAFLLPDFRAGGAERLTIDLMAGFVEAGAAVDLVLCEARGEFLDMLPEGVRVVDLGASRLRRAVGPLRRYLATQQPDALIAAMWPLTLVAVLAAAGLSPRPRVVIADHCALLEQYGESPRTLLALRSSIRLGYRFADAVVAVSASLGRELAALAGLAPSRVATIWNPIPEPLRGGGPSPWGEAGGKRVLAVGTLKAQKGFPLLLEAFALLLHETDATLAIVGEGPDRPALEARIAAMGLADRVRLPGFTATPGDWYAGADLFVLSSFYEGFGNVLVEAMHCGLPVVATDCPHGPAEVLGRGRWGALVPPGDAPALALAMAEALRTPVDRQAQQARAREFSRERAVAAYWERAFPA